MGQPDLIRVYRHGFYYERSLREYIEEHPVTLAILLAALLGFALT